MTTDQQTEHAPNEFDVGSHDHVVGLTRRYIHTHAWASTLHNHLARAVCSRPECKGFETHNIHSGPRP